MPREAEGATVLDRVRASLERIRRSLTGFGEVTIPTTVVRTCPACEHVRIEAETAVARVEWLESELRKAYARISALEAEADAGPPSRPTIRVDARVES